MELQVTACLGKGNCTVTVWGTQVHYLTDTQCTLLCRVYFARCPAFLLSSLPGCSHLACLVIVNSHLCYNSHYIPTDVTGSARSKQRCLTRTWAELSTFQYFWLYLIGWCNQFAENIIHCTVLYLVSLAVLYLLSAATSWDQCPCTQECHNPHEGQNFFTFIMRANDLLFRQCGASFLVRSHFESLFSIAGVTNRTDAGSWVVRIKLTMTYYIRTKF